MGRIGIKPYEGDNYNFRILLNDVPIGGFLLTPNKLLNSYGEGVAMLFNFTINEEHRNKGYGKRVLSWIFDEAKQTGATILALDTPRTNLRAQHLYECMGFEKIRESDRDFYYRKDLDNGRSSSI